MVCLACGFIWPSVIAHFSTVVTERISYVGSSAYESNWFDYPVKFQKYIILIIARSEQRVYFTGFKLCSFSVEIWGKVNNISQNSYFCPNGCGFFIYKTFNKNTKFTAS